MTLAIEVCRLAKLYGPIEALRGIDFCVRRGEVFGLLGPNGAGKTTTLRILSGQLLPSSGEARVLGRDATLDSRAVRFLVGLAPSNPRSLDWRLTGLENLVRFGMMYYLDPREARRRAVYYLELMGLAEAAERRVGQYSSGMMAKLLIARALLHEPPVLLLDEPWAALDPEARRDLVAMLRILAHGGGRTVLVSSHDLALVEQVCDSVAIIDSGRIVAWGGTSDLIASLPFKSVVELEFSSPEAALTGASLLNGDACEVELAGRHAVARTDAPLRLLEKVLSRPLLASAGVSVRRPSLDDVYRQAVGGTCSMGEGSSDERRGLCV